MPQTHQDVAEASVAKKIKTHAAWEAILTRRVACRAMDEAILAAAIAWQEVVTAWVPLAEAHIWNGWSAWRLPTAVWPPAGAASREPIISEYLVIGDLADPGKPLQIWRDCQLQTVVVWGEWLEAQRIILDDLKEPWATLEDFRSDDCEVFFYLPPGATAADLDPPYPDWSTFVTDRLGRSPEELRGALSDLGREMLRALAHAANRRQSFQRKLARYAESDQENSAPLR